MAEEKSQIKQTEEDYFTESGLCEDEVVLIFDDGHKMYVSAGFLIYTSPVFKAMFHHECKEKSTREVKLNGKSFEDFRDFLLCLHPAVQNPIDKTNVLWMVALAEEYQVKSLITKSKNVLLEWLRDVVDSSRLTNSGRTEACLQILQQALHFGYKDVEQMAVKTIARFGHRTFTGVMGNSSYYDPDKTVDKCKTLFNSLPEKTKTEILLARLNLCDDEKMR